MNYKFLLIVAFFWVGLRAEAQLAIGYYPFQSVLSVSSNTEKLLWGDLRAETNTFFGNINFESHLMLNLKRSSWVNFYSGLGVNINPSNSTLNISVLNGYIIDFGARIKPIQKHPNFQVLFEISPYLNKQLNGGILRTFLGVGYNFGTKNLKHNKKQTAN